MGYIYGHQLTNVFTQLQALGLTPSRHAFAREWCGAGKDYLYDRERRGGQSSRVAPSTVRRLRERLAEAACLLPPELASQVREIDASIVRDMRVASLVGRRSYR